MSRPSPILALAFLAFLAVAGCGSGEAERASRDPGLFVNSREALTDARADHYVDFEFRYPAGWRVVQDASTPGTPSFVKVEHTSAEGTTVESFAAGWFADSAAARGDSAALRTVLGDLEGQFSRAFAGFEKTSSGVDSIADRRALGFRFAFRLPAEAEVTAPGAGSLWFPPGARTASRW